MFSAGPLQFGRAWLALTLALAAHVADEALTDFLSVYNPLVRGARERFGWFPMPTFDFDVWLSGLIALVILLLVLTPPAFSDAPVMKLAAFPFAGIMLMNGMGHLAGSIYMGRWMPGATTAPLLLGASVWLFREAARSRRRNPLN
jgi:Protein of unknown function with HXXEE motif